MDKKKIGLIAILLFLLIGLGSFVFANPDNEEKFEGREPSGREEIDSKGDGESTKDDGDVSDSETLVTGESDGQNNGQATDNQRAARNVRNTTITGGTNGVTGGNGNNGGNTTTGNGGNGGSTIDYYADALKAVETAESSLSQADVDKATELVKKVTNQEQKDALTDRLNDVQDIIDVTSLVSRLETMVADSTDRNGILDSIDFRDKEKVEELVNDLKNGDAKDNLVGRLETVNKILNDNDGPVIKGIDNNSFTRKDVELTIKDDNDVTIKVTKDGTEVDYTGKFTEEGTYVITAVDAAFNETTLTFTIDKTMPVIKGVEDGGLYNHAVTVTIDEVKIQDAKYLYEGKWYSFESGATFDKDGTYFIRVTDAAYNKKAELTFTIDTKVETPKWVYVLNVSDENNRQTIRNGQTLRVEVNSKEELTELPVLTIGNGQSATARKCSQEDYGYVCVIDLKIDNTVAKLEDGKEIPFTITNIKDKAGNTLTLDNDDVTSTKKYGQVTYDESAPVVKSLGITDIDEYKDETGKLYIKNGGTVRVLVYFEEKLGTEPTVKLGGKEYKATYREASSRPKDNSYAYYADIKITDEMNLADGIIPFEVYGYTDKVGNVGTLLTQADVNSKTYPSVTLDNTKPVLNFNNGLITSGFTVKATDDNFDYMEIKYVDGRKPQIIKEPVFELEKSGDNTRYNITVYDKAGNISDYRDIYLDTVKPEIDGKAINGGKEVSLENNGVYQKVSLNITDGSMKTVSLVKEDGSEEVLETYKDNYTADKMKFEKTFDQDGTYTIKAVDRNKNESTITFTIDTKKPVLNAANILVDGDVNEQKYFYAKVGDTIFSYVRFNEQLKELPTFTLINNGKKYEVKDVQEMAYKDGQYGYQIKYQIDENTEMTDGEIEMLVTNIQDKAGNKYDDITKPTNGHIVYLDMTAPEIALHKNNEEKVIEPGNHKYCVRATVSDKNLKSVKLNGADYKSDTVICDDNDYVLTALDKAGNEKTINFIVDRTKPVISINETDFKGTDNKDLIYNKVDLKITEVNDYTVTVWKDSKKVAYDEVNFNEDGKYKVEVKDAAKNKTTVEFTVDTIPVGFVNIKVNSNNKNLSYAKLDDTVGVYLFVNEELKELPTFVINGKEYRAYDQTDTGSDVHKYVAFLRVDDNTKEGLVEFTISNIYDKAGNVLHDENGNVLTTLTNANTEQKVIVDKTAPVYKSLGIYGGNKYNNVMYVTKGDRIYIIC